MYRQGWSKLSCREDAEEAVELLIDHDWLRETTDKTPGRPRSRYWINPKLRPAVEDRAGTKSASRRH